MFHLVFLSINCSLLRSNLCGGRIGRPGQDFWTGLYTGDGVAPTEGSVLGTVSAGEGGLSEVGTLCCMTAGTSCCVRSCLLLESAVSASLRWVLFRQTNPSGVLMRYGRGVTHLRLLQSSIFHPGDDHWVCYKRIAQESAALAPYGQFCHSEILL